MSGPIAECWTSIVRFHDPRPAGIVEVARTYEREGWDGAVFADSQSIAPDVFVMLTAIAMSTDRLRFTTGVTVPLTRQPAVVASAAAAIQEVSGGRMQLALGRGDTALAYLGLSPTRLATFEKFATQVKRYLAGETLPLPEVAPVMEGAVHGFEDLAVGNGPDGSSLIWMDRAEPRVPVEIAATGPKALEMAGRVGDRVALMVGADPERVAWAIERVRAGARDAGRDPDSLGFTAFTSVAVTDGGDGRRERELVVPFVAVGSRFRVMDRKVRGFASDRDRKVLEGMLDTYDISQHAQGGQGRGGLDEDYISAYTIVGEPAYCLERLQRLADLGVDRFVLSHSTPDQPEHEEMRARLVHEVLPTMQGREPAGGVHFGEIASARSESA
ncbi:LLM class flavin-dependent oxidoreductase [Agromyces sp. Marseille-P2726]|uniref:LLM class flavin-dependent oxidoreductase n=1 Tax=Agromyces sp. Marseille-P2726 TaxID=2709132 RepID=UPI00156DE860|nr:LLM class flavin-dependent oxidoreductase [Agromyces sp. Marseille-P2726]